MTLLTVFIAIGVVSVVWYVISSILICNELLRRGERLNFLLVRLLLPVWVHRYKKLTVQETGEAGALYYHWVISILTLAVTAICAIATKASLS